jgi:hypothetical protein
MSPAERVIVRPDARWTPGAAADPRRNVSRRGSLGPAAGFWAGAPNGRVVPTEDVEIGNQDELAANYPAVGAD